MERREWFGGVCLGRSDYGCPAQFTYLYPSITLRSLSGLFPGPSVVAYTLLQGG